MSGNPLMSALVLGKIPLIGGCLKEVFAHQAMTLHLFVKRAARQLQLFHDRFDLAFVPAQGCTQALRLERFLLGRE